MYEQKLYKGKKIYMDMDAYFIHNYVWKIFSQVDTQKGNISINIRSTLRCILKHNSLHARGEDASKVSICCKIPRMFGQASKRDLCYEIDRDLACSFILYVLHENDNDSNHIQT